MKVCLLVLSLILALLASCRPAVSQQVTITALPAVQEPSPTAGYSRQFQQEKCWFKVPDGVEVTCGYVQVAEDRQKGMTPGNTLRLAVAVFRATSGTPAPDPIVYHVGGPGGHMLGIVSNIYEKVIAPYLQTRDLILFDPRGTGYSQPALECAQGEEPGNCVRRLFAEGHNLYAYNSSSMAADLRDIRRALGYDAWNLIGESYGSHVAQIVMREQPEGLRSVILDAVVPVKMPPLPHGKSEFELSLGHLIQSCQKDAACSAAYPDLQSALDRAVRQLNTQPVTLQFDIDGTAQSSRLTGDRLMNNIMTAMYEAEMIPYLPYAIEAAADGTSYTFWDYTLKWEINTGRILSSGAHWAILCGDGRIPGCDNWPIAIEQKPVTSSVPTLILNGEFDPVTPPEYGHEVSRWLRNRYVVEFPGLGHWANGTGHACQRAIIQAFLSDPDHQPNMHCVEEMQTFHFVSPQAAQTVLPERSGAPQANSTASPEVFQPVVKAGWLTILSLPSDRAAAEDVARAIQSHQSAVCDVLQTGCQFPVMVEIYPSQMSFNEHIMNPEMRGYYAISGKRTIQMVSPQVQPAQRNIPYEERVLIAVHEYTHLVLNEITPNLPDWLAEGAALYLGPHDLYDQACRQGLPFEPNPHLKDLVDSYTSVPSADLYAYTLVRYIAETKGLTTLNQLIRSPADFPALLKLSAQEIEAQWHDFLKRICG